MWLYRLNRALGPVIGACWRLGIAGEVESIPRTGGFLVAPNHSSVLDPWMIGMRFPRTVRWLITYRWYVRSRTAHFLFRSLGTVPVRPGDPAGTIDAVVEALEGGDGVGVFPEGGLSVSGRIRRFRSGIARMAARSGAPVIPVGVRGAFESLPSHRRLPRFRRVTIVVGAPMRFPGSPLDADPPRGEIETFVLALRAEVSRLSGKDLEDGGADGA